ncbi:MAG: hypothetical protein OEV55_02765 [candidate division Zixibacteria bacterium]|nr:hypothetical protein [candidate division Zixibacteria bacterium]
MRKKKIINIMLVVAIILAFICFSAEARTKYPPKNSLAKPMGTLNIPTDAKFLTINNISMPIMNDAVFSQHPYTGRAGTEWPQGTENLYLFGAGIWVGAQIPIVGDTILKKVVSYGYNPNDGYSEWGPGIIVSPDVANHGDECPSENCWPILLSTEADSIWSPQDSLNWPLKDTLGNLKFVSAEDSWCFYNDADLEYHDDQASPGDQLNILVKQTTYAFASKLDKDIIFMVWDLYNQGDNDLDSVYIGITADPDLGNATDDMIGFDSTRNFCWVWNYNLLSDQDIHGIPGMMGFRFFESPLDSAGNQLGLTALTLFTIDTDPANDEERYNLMAGRTTSGGPRDPFMIDTSPQDKRFCQSTGPFSLPVGGSARVVFGVVAGQNENLLKVNSDYAQSLYDAGFVAPIPPIRPVVNAVPGDQQVTLVWGDTSETSYEPFSEADTDLVPYDFQGYRVYRSRTGVEGDFEALAEFDLADGITNDTEEDVDPVYGTPITVPVHLGSDSGIKHFFVDSTNVLNGETYYYAVVAYDYQPKRPKSLESGKRASMVEVIPGTNPAGYQTATSDTLATHTSTGAMSDGYVSITVVDPTMVTGHTYEVTFDDTSSSTTTWSLKDVNLDKVVLDNQTNQEGDDNYLIVDGLLVKVAGPPPGIKRVVEVLEDGSYDNVFYSLNHTGDWYLDSDNGDITRLNGWGYVGIHDYELRFSSDSSGYYDWNTDGLFPDKAPFQVWDVGIATFSDTTDDQRIIFEILDDDESGGYSPEDRIYTVAVPYVEPLPDPTSWTFPDDTRVSRIRIIPYSEGFVNPVEGTIIRFLTNKPNSANDVFTFHTRTEYISAAQAKVDMDKIKVVPNPYFVRNILDRDPNVSHLMLTHLPEVCTIRLYTLAGHLIGQIDHTNGTGQEIWNVLTRNDQVPASGVYIYHISSEFGEKVGRFAIIR